MWDILLSLERRGIRGHIIAGESKWSMSRFWNFFLLTGHFHWNSTLDFLRTSSPCVNVESITATDCTLIFRRDDPDKWSHLTSSCLTIKITRKHFILTPRDMFWIKNRYLSIEYQTFPQNLLVLNRFERFSRVLNVPHIGIHHKW